MARPEKVLRLASGPLTDFATDLRSLREAAGQPQYARLAKIAGYSASTLSQAANGTRLPTLDVTLAYVGACGGDVVSWREKWAVVDATIRTAAMGDDAVVPPAVVGTASRWRVIRPPSFIVVAVILLVAGAVWLIVPSWSKEPSGTGTHARSSSSTLLRQVADGADPKDSGCAGDPAVTTVDSSEIDIDGSAVGVLELRYAPICGVSWGRFYTGPNINIDKSGQRIYIDVVRPDGGGNQAFDLNYIDGLTVYGNVLHSTTSCVYVVGYLYGPGWKSSVGRTGCFRGTTGLG